MSSSKLYWPELYGFTIYGNGPTFVVYVEPDSIAETGGLRSGDRIIELDEQNVSNLSAGVIKFMARNSKRNPPSISVQSCCVDVEIVPNKKLSTYGFTVIGDLPVFVDGIDEIGPAYAAGLRQGDVILELNGKRIQYAEDVDSIISSISSGRIKLKYLRILKSYDNKKRAGSHHRLNETNTTRAINDSGWNEEKLEKAKKFYSILNDVLANDPDKRKIILDELKNYTKTSDVYKLASNLNKVLRAPEERIIVDGILPFIPHRHQGKFKSLMDIEIENNARKSSHSKTKSDLQHSSERPMNGNFDSGEYYNSNQNKLQCDSSMQTDIRNSENQNNIIYPKYESKEVASLYGKRTVTVIRENGEKFGFMLRGHKPVVIESVDKESPSEFAQIYPNDVILSIDGINVEDKSHRFLVELLKTSGRRTVFEVMQKLEYDLSNLNKPAKPVSTDINETYKLNDLFHLPTNLYSNHDVYEVKNGEGKTFKEKINELLNANEKFKLKKYILDYNSTKNIWEFISRTNDLLDTPAKQGLWFFLQQLVDYDHQDYVRNIMNFNYDLGGKKSTSFANLYDKYTENPEKNYSLITKETYKQPHSPTPTSKLRKMKEFGSAPSLLVLDEKAAENELIFLFARQLDYLLNFDEKSNIKFALKKYNEDRDIYSFANQIDDILDTPAKRTLWFHLIPLLDEDDQEYCKRKLCLPTLVTRKHYNPLQSSTNKVLSGASAGTLSAMPMSKSAIKSYYYKSDYNDKNDKNFYDDDFVLTDKEIDNLFDLTNHLPENKDISSSRLNSPNRWPKSDEEEEINYFKPTSSRRRRDLSAGLNANNHQQKTNINTLSNSNRWKSSTLTSEVWKKTRCRSNHLLYAETKTLNFEEAETFMSALIKQNIEDFEIKIQFDSNINTSSSPSSLYSIPEIITIKNDSIHFRADIKKPKNEEAITNEPSPSKVSQNTDRLMKSKTNSNFYLKKDDDDENASSPTVSSITEFTNKYKSENFFDYQKAVLELLVDERIGKRFQPNEIESSDNRLSVSSVNTEDSVGNSEQVDKLRHSLNENNFQNNNETVNNNGESTILNKNSMIPKITLTASSTPDHVTLNDEDLLNNHTKSAQAPPPPPPAPPLPVNLLKNNVNNLYDKKNSSLKRVNWEKIENKNLSGTLWEKLTPNENLNQIIKYLDIDTMFARKQSSAVNLNKPNANKMDEIRVLNSRKAYNIAIVLASLKCSWNDVFSSLYGKTENVLTSQLIKHILRYYPNDDEMKLYKTIENSDNLSIPDKFMYQLSSIPNSEFRLRSLQFKCDFNEKIYEYNQNLDKIKLAVDQVRESVKLKKIIELILAIGNYLNQGSDRLSKANAFKINVLPQLDQIKIASNGSYTLMNLLAKLCFEQNPETIELKKELSSVETAAKISNKVLSQEIHELQAAYKSIETSINNLVFNGENDDFKDSFSKFFNNASIEIDNLLKKHQKVENSYIALVKYFGEDTEFLNTEQFFSIINEFLNKFEDAHRRNFLAFSK